MTLFYLAYRYNVLYVAETEIDTRGLIYPQALKQLLSGVYIAEICLVGMFSVSKAVGPAVLMAIFLALTILCHISLSKTLNPLLYTLPLSLQLQDDVVDQSQRKKPVDGRAETRLSAASTAADKRNMVSKLEPGAIRRDQGKANFFTKWLKPSVYADHVIMSQLAHHTAHKRPEYLEQAEGHAYSPPSATSQTPVLWVPADAGGVSEREVSETGKVIRISNKGCKLNDRSHIEWDSETPQPPD
jgi:hypothetical protein